MVGITMYEGELATVPRKSYDTACATSTSLDDITKLLSGGRIPQLHHVVAAASTKNLSLTQELRRRKVRRVPSKRRQLPLSACVPSLYDSAIHCDQSLTVRRKTEARGLGCI